VDGLTEALQHYKESGFGIAIDDLGAGFSSLRLWSDLLPEIVKLDMHFVQGVHRDSIKYNFLRAVQDIATRCGAHIVAEGVETEDDLLAVRKLGIRYGQGYLISRPAAEPPLSVPTRVLGLLSAARMRILPEDSPLMRRQATVQKLLIPAPALDASAHNEAVFEYFENHPAQTAIPIVAGERPAGLINRHFFIDRYARQYGREIFGRKSCLLFADRSPLIVDKGMTIHNLSRILIDAESRHLSEGFLITEDGRYLGFGTGQDLVREITQMQIEAARYANPLTLLPGNVPIDENIQRLLHAGMRFVVCHCDLDSFKPFNDRYGYQRGDDMLLLTARVLAGACDASSDFIGHVGGDDFILLMQSSDWEARVQRALNEFDRFALDLFDEAERGANGFQGTDRLGNPVSFALTTLSVGAVIIEPDTHHQHKEVAMRAAEAKKQAKRMRGSVCFVERRAMSGAHTGLSDPTPRRTP
jgi:diguanylate cyclase (GGDEF)-like protein